MSNQPVQYEQPVYSDPGFPIMFHTDFMDEGRRAIYTNWHTGIELLYCLEGTGQVWYGSEIADFGPGDLVSIGSNIIHTLHLTGTHCIYHCMIVEPFFLKAHGFSVADMRFVPVIRDPNAHRLFEAAAETLVQMDALYKPLVLAQVLMLFVRLVKAHTLPLAQDGPDGARKGQDTIMQALDYIREHLCEPIRLDQLCRHVGMSKYYLCRQFLAYTGTSVIHHINALKCDFARKLILENGFNVSEAAHHLGFQNLSYFSKLYRKHVGTLPSQAASDRAIRAKRGEVYGILKGITDEGLLGEA